MRLERLGLLGGEFLATFCGGGRPGVGGVFSTGGSASGIPDEGGASHVFFRCTLLRLYTVPRTVLNSEAGRPTLRNQE